MAKIISKTKIKSRTRKKTNPVLVETISTARKNHGWLPVAKMLASPKALHSSLNLSDIDRQTTPGDTVVIPGKVLSGGNLTKKVRICALSISEKAKEKLKESKSEIVSILEEIHKNPKAQGVKILR